MAFSAFTSSEPHAAELAETLGASPDEARRISSLSSDAADAARRVASLQEKKRMAFQQRSDHVESAPENINGQYVFVFKSGEKRTQVVAPATPENAPLAFYHNLLVEAVPLKKCPFELWDGPSAGQRSALAEAVSASLRKQREAAQNDVESHHRDEPSKGSAAQSSSDAISARPSLSTPPTVAIPGRTPALGRRPAIAPKGVPIPSSPPVAVQSHPAESAPRSLDEEGGLDPVGDEVAAQAFRRNSGGGFRPF